MDCPSEEQLVRMKLADLSNIKHLQFLLSEKKLIVVHDGDIGAVAKRIDDLNLGSTLLSTDKAHNEAGEVDENKKQQKTLWVVLLINLCFFVVEMTYGWLSNSMALVADSLDMLADAFVYGLSLMVIGHAISRKKYIAKLSGYLQILLATMGLVEVIRRFLGMSQIPVFQNMIVVSFLALVANLICYWLILKTKSNEVHMRASAIFTSNDIVINLGVIVAGLLVYLTLSPIPDLMAGIIVFLIVLRGAFKILQLSN